MDFPSFQIRATIYNDKGTKSKHQLNFDSRAQTRFNIDLCCLMSVVSQNLISKNPKLIRNICIVAHVDHGKTTLVDYLLASNQIICEAMAGQLRYLDSREDEQERKITMKSSSIMLKYTQNNTDYIINLIDSPGHADFSSEVSCAVRLCDGAVVLIDAVEGVCPQTEVVLRQVWQEGIKPCLVINKIDRLISEIMLSPLDAYDHIFRIVEEVNSLMACICQETESEEEKLSTYFSPLFGNVIFCSGIEGWGFGINFFAELFSKKLGVSSQTLFKGFWGDFYFDPKTKSVNPDSTANEKKPMFVKFILETIWSIYDAFLSSNSSEEQRDKIISFISPPKMLKRAYNLKDHYLDLMRYWLPITRFLLGMIVEDIPSPLYLGEKRIKNLLSSPLCPFENLPAQSKDLKTDFYKCNSSLAAPVIIYVSKMVYYEDKEINRCINYKKKFADESLSLSDKLVAFSRIFSGTIKQGMKLYVLTPKHLPHDSDIPQNHDYTYKEIIVNDLFIMMGRDLIPVDSVPAGNIMGIGGLGDYIFKTGTISSTLYCPSFSPMGFQMHPIISVAVEPVKISDYDEIVKSLNIINLSDPVLQLEQTESGEHVIKVTGEVHLQKIIKDLQDLLQNIPINISDPILPFRETLACDKTPLSHLSYPEFISDLMDPSDFILDVSDKLITAKSLDGMFLIKIQVETLGNDIICFMEENFQHFENLCSQNLTMDTKKMIENKMESLFSENMFLKDFNPRRIISIGPKKAYNNILLDNLPYDQSLVRSLFSSDNENFPGNLDVSLSNAFDFACFRGPLMSEPVAGACFIIQEFCLNTESVVLSQQSCEFSSAGQLLSLAKRAFHCSLLASGALRCSVPMYRCKIRVNAKFLGAIFNFISKKAGRVLEETQIEGTHLFKVDSLIPLPEIFGLSDEIRSKTSGSAQVLLVFESWMMIDADPFLSRELLEEATPYSKLMSFRVMEYINRVRKVKGLPIDHQVVEDGEKQRTFKRNK